MPKKTKKQKLLAQKRREKIAIKPMPTIVPEIKAAILPTSYSLSPSSVIRKETVGTTQNHVAIARHSVVFDIWKIFVLSLLAFSFEIGVYWLLHHS